MTTQFERDWLARQGIPVTQELTQGQEQEIKDQKRLTGYINTPNIFSVENVPQDLMFWALMILMMKHDPKSVERILVTLFNNMGNALNNYCRAGSANAIAAYGSGRLLSLFMERFGLITQGQALSFSVSLMAIQGIETAQDIIQLITPWNVLKKDIDFPTTVVLGDTRIVRERSTADLIAIEEAKRK